MVTQLMELEMLISGLRQDNSKLRELLNEKDAEVFELREELKKVKELKDLEKRVADIEEQLEKNIFLLDDEGTPIKSFTLTGKLVLMEEPEHTEEKLEVGKWYDARTFEVEKLKELLPRGTQVAITTNISEDEQRTREPKTCIVHTKVTRIGKEKSKTVFYVERYQTIENYWFKIIEEN